MFQEEKNYRYQDINFKYYDSGNINTAALPTLICLGGIMQNLRSLIPLSNILSKHMRVVLVDLPGMGRADYLPPTVGYDFIINALKALIDELNIQQVSILAYSFSAQIAYAFSIAYPNIMVNLVLGAPLISAAHLKNNFDFVGLAQDLDKDSQKAFVLNHFKKSLEHNKNVIIKNEDFAKRLMRDHIEYLTDSDIEKIISNFIRASEFDDYVKDKPVPLCNVFIFSGEHDEATTPVYCKNILNIIPQAKLVFVKDCDHLVYMEQGQLVLSLITEYLVSGKILDAPEIMPYSN